MKTGATRLTTKTTWRCVAAIALSLMTACSSTTNGADVLDVQSDTTMDTTAPADTMATDSALPSDGGFTCGAMTCDAATQYCQVLRLRDADGGVVDDYRCDSFDIACPTDHSCSCLQRSLKCINACTTDTGGVTAVCGS